MRRRPRALLIAALVLAASGLWMWWSAASPAEREIRRRLMAMVAELNSGATEGLESVLRAARIGQFFTDDVVVELGQGSPPLRGRDTLIGMAARLQTRTAAFVVELEDVKVQVVEDGHAEIALTAVIRRRHVASGEESLDARELSGDVRHTAGEWRVSRIVAVETLR